MLYMNLKFRNCVILYTMRKAIIILLHFLKLKYMILTEQGYFTILIKTTNNNKYCTVYKGYAYHPYCTKN